MLALIVQQELGETIHAKNAKNFEAKNKKILQNTKSKAMEPLNLDVERTGRLQFAPFFWAFLLSHIELSHFVEMR